MAAAGAMALIFLVFLILVSARPAEAARRRDNMEHFCRAASDLCVFTCNGDYDCPSLSDGYICESRHGTLVVEENGETTYYETSYSFCCEYDDFDTDPHTRKRLLQARKRCEKKLTDECVEHFAQDQPGTDTTRGGQIEISVKDFFGAAYQGSTTVHWGGDEGYITGCRKASAVAESACFRVPNKTVASGPDARRGGTGSRSVLGVREDFRGDPQRSRWTAQQVLLGTLSAQQRCEHKASPRKPCPL